MSLSEFSLKRPVTAAMVTLSVLVVGYVAFGRLPIEQFPSISSSGISASVRYSSASPEEVERLITVPLEAALGTLNNVDRISSSSRNGNASVRVDFKAGTDMDLANMEMRERADQARVLAQQREWQAEHETPDATVAEHRADAVDEQCDRCHTEPGDGGQHGRASLDECDRLVPPIDRQCRKVGGE